jgi:voltage-gated potassium channel
MARRRRASIRTLWLYSLRLLREFRGTLLLLFAMVAVGGFLYHTTAFEALGGRRPSFFTAFYSAWMAVLAQSVLPQERWYLQVVGGAYPLFGFILVGEGIVRLGMLMISRKEGEKEWMTVMASTYRDHVIICGLGHLGYRIFGQLIASDTPVVALERDSKARFLDEAKRTGAPILIRDMKEDQALIDAGVQHARAIVIATNDDMANLEVALDSRRLNPKIRIIMRQYDQQIADKLRESKLIDEAFSSAALAAPVVADMARAALKTTTV